MNIRYFLLFLCSLIACSCSSYDSALLRPASNKIVFTGGVETSQYISDDLAIVMSFERFTENNAEFYATFYNESERPINISLNNILCISGGDEVKAVNPYITKEFNRPIPPGGILTGIDKEKQDEINSHNIEIGINAAIAILDLAATIAGAGDDHYEGYWADKALAYIDMAESFEWSEATHKDRMYFLEAKKDYYSQNLLSSQLTLPPGGHAGGLIIFSRRRDEVKYYNIFINIKGVFYDFLFAAE